MEELIPLLQPPVARQPQRIRPETLGDAVRLARQRAIQARHIASSYNQDGWKNLFEEYVPEPSNLNAINRESEKSDRTLGNSATSPITSAKTSTPAGSQSLSQTRKAPSGGESTASAPNPATISLCPSGKAEASDAVIFGVVGGNASAPRVGYLSEVVPINKEALTLSGSVKFTEIFRVASTCAEQGCQNFDGSHCRLATTIVEHLPPVVEVLPTCRIRPQCRWWQQEGKAACLRCSQVVRDNYYVSDLTRQVGVPLAELKRLE